MNILCISNIDWQSAWQRHQTFMTKFAEDGHKVLYLNNSGFRSLKLKDFGRIKNRFFINPKLQTNPVHPNVNVISPIAVSSNGFLGRSLNKKILVKLLLNKIQKLGFSKFDLIFLYLPTPFSKALVEALPFNQMIYDYVSDFQSHPEVPKDFSLTHHALLGLSNVVLTDNTSLFEELKEQHCSVHLLHHGVEDFFFDGSEYRVVSSVKELCYFGTVDATVLDFDLISQLSTAVDRIDFIGPVRGVIPKLPDNVKLITPLPINLLAEKIREYDGLLLPYKKTEFNKSVMPAKIYQCLATGLPIFSYNLPQLNCFAKDGLLYCPADFGETKKIIGGIKEFEGKRSYLKRVFLAKENSTTTKYLQLLRVLNLHSVLVR